MPQLSSPPPDLPRARWRWLNWLGLDAVAVAVAWLYVFGRMTGARVLPVEAVCLGTVVWLIYMVDRMLDARTGGRAAERHQFAERHARWLLPVMFVMAAGALWWALHAVGWITLKSALWVGWAVGLYFCIVVASRWRAVSHVLLLGVSGLLVMGLVQGEDTTWPGVQLWRAVVVGTMATVLYVGLRYQYDLPPWILTKKWLGGYLFAVGVAVVPFSHLENWPGLLHGTPVMLFGAVCALNSLGIRLWEDESSANPELAMLRRLYPWLLAAVGGGALAEAWAADEWTRPVLCGMAGCAAGFGLLHLMRSWPPAGRALAADGTMVAAALLVRWVGMQGLS